MAKPAKPMKLTLKYARELRAGDRFLHNGWWEALADPEPQGDNVRLDCCDRLGARRERTLDASAPVQVAAEPD